MPGPSHVAISEKYEISVEAVRDWAVEASDFLRLCAGDMPEIKQELLAQVRGLEKLCKENKRTFKGVVYDAPEYRTMLGAMELRARLNGLLDKQGGPTDGTEEVSIGELLKLLESRGYEVRRKRGDTGSDGTGTGSGIDRERPAESARVEPGAEPRTETPSSDRSEGPEPLGSDRQVGERVDRTGRD